MENSQKLQCILSEADRLVRNRMGGDIDLGRTLDIGPKHIEIPFRFFKGTIYVVFSDENKWGILRQGWEIANQVYQRYQKNLYERPL